MDSEQFIKIAIVDIDGVLRGKLISKDKFEAIKTKGGGFCNVIFGWDLHDQLYGTTPVSDWENGFMDYTFQIDLSSERKLSKENDRSFYFADFYQNETKPIAPCPRTILGKTLDKAESLGLFPVVGTDIEWFNFKKNESEEIQPITKGMFGYSLIRLYENHSFFDDILSTCDKAGIAIEGFHTETGPGVTEAALNKTNALRMADNIVLFKLLVKQIGHDHRIQPSFMAKWNKELPGCSAHLHLSFGEESNSTFSINENGELNSFSKHFIAGILNLLPECCLFHAPNVNSYKRFVKGSWAPVNLSWGFENRTTSIRIIPDQKAGFRLEFRVPGADLNPYLSISALLESGLYGLENRLDPSPYYCQGNAYDKKNTKIPNTLSEAVKTFYKSKQLKSIYNPDFIEHLYQVRKHESALYNEHITDWELKRYFEII